MPKRRKRSNSPKEGEKIPFTKEQKKNIWRGITKLTENNLTKIKESITKLIENKLKKR